MTSAVLKDTENLGGYSIGCVKSSARGCVLLIRLWDSILQDLSKFATELQSGNGVRAGNNHSWKSLRKAEMSVSIVSRCTRCWLRTASRLQVSLAWIALAYSQSIS